jgi:hypothetical protein
MSEFLSSSDTFISLSVIKLKISLSKLGKPSKNFDGWNYLFFDPQVHVSDANDQRREHDRLMQRRRPRTGPRQIVHILMGKSLCKTAMLQKIAKISRKRKILVQHDHD